MDGFLLDCFDFQGFHLHIEDLTQVHHDAFVDFLPKMGPENLNQGDLQGGNLTMHEDTSQIELNLETNINIGTIHSR